MKLKSVSTEQFAGITNKSIEFTDGVNVICGKNESGKSTLVNLISNLLFRNDKINKKSDSEFVEKLMPGARNDGKTPGDCVDGELKIEDNGNEYKLKREWEKSTGKTEKIQGKSKFYDGDTKYGDWPKISNELHKLLKYEQGVYKEMLIAPQNCADTNLKELLDSAGKTDCQNVLAQKVSEAFNAGDGINIDELENAIKNKIDVIAGKYWDIENNREINPNRKYNTSKGEILPVIYKIRELEDEYKKITDEEKKRDELEDTFAQLKKEEEELKKSSEEFDKYYSQIISLNLNQTRLANLQKVTDDAEKALKSYPENLDKLKKAKEIQTELNNFYIKQQFNSASDAKNKLDKLAEQLSQTKCPESDEIQKIISHEKEISRLENALCAMNIVAKIKMLGGNSVVVKSALTGETVDAEEDLYSITQAVTIEIPGVMEMELSPAQINILEIKEKISELQTERQTILDKYNCKTADEMKLLADNYKNVKSQKDTAQTNFETALNGADFESLKKNAEQIADVREYAEIEKDINDKFGGNIDVFMGGVQREIRDFEEKYHSEEEVTSLISQNKPELEKIQKEIDLAKDIPEKYKNMSDPDEYKNTLRARCENASVQREQAKIELVQSEEKLAGYDMDSGEIADEIEKSEQEKEEKINLLNNWKHIYSVFLQKKKELKGNPLEDLADNFRKNLEIITKGQIKPAFSPDGNPDFTLSSGNNCVNYDILSDGTKDTVYLAYRLAVLDHLFPDGGGFIILDDPMINMDIERTQESCELIKDCAKRHQIIIFTCREDYSDLLNTKNINL